LLINLHHSKWGSLNQSGILAHFSATPARVDHAAPLLGEHTEEILGHYLGYTAAKIAELRARRIIRSP